jgi:RimJ/RimL family protein N-acetyltransferase
VGDVPDDWHPPVDGELRLPLLESCARDDVARLFLATLEDADIARFTRMPPVDRRAYEDARAAAGSFAGDFASGRSVACAVEVAGELCGRVTAVALDPALGRCELAYWLLARQVGRGVAGRAVELFVARLADLGFTHIVLAIEPENARSRRLAERHGWRRLDGEVRERPGNAGTVHVEMWYRPPSHGDALSIAELFSPIDGRPWPDALL